MRTLFISDLHLEAERPDITRAFLRFLDQEAQGCAALYILGDFFEVWIGDDAQAPFQRDIATRLKALSAVGTVIYLMHGNRDFMLGKAFCRQAGATLLADPTVITLAGERTLLTHGDLLCTEDLGYQKMRRLLRNPVSLWLLRHLPLSKRQQLARKLRNQSKNSTQMKAAAIMDVTPSAVTAYLQQYGCTRMIHGHTHRPARHPLTLPNASAERIVLGDWDQHLWYLEAHNDALTLQQQAL
ncbi:UDP-2,3-diacylglucosamine diphosphatase [Atopomonas sediminilitoris]|uniref:UDP-2,3-diacylglucosamine diphosphatase n=1 Tax=Atopomonas sediminilitoris TaxID=2919919 RepID=UPI001F4D9181|nr:UDP-2,3-diacylglucosamine diphosphatase [Atopomonas sediminilitoris]